jgi:aminopeptidase N
MNKNSALLRVFKAFRAKLFRGKKAMNDNANKQPEALRLADYRRPEFSANHVALDFKIHDDHTIATSNVTYYRTAEGKASRELVLNAENPNSAGKDFVRSLSMNGVKLAEGTGYVYDKDKHEIRITLDPSDDNVELEIETYLEPQNNTELVGLYKSDSAVVTQCESQGFRRITPFLDRPDVMAKYTVSVEADEAKFPVLLANGNKIAEQKLPGGRHKATFEDPWPKPCYLFCTANGDIKSVDGAFTTKSGRNVRLRVFTEPGLEQKAVHALESLKTSMKWDEDVFGCEYDLDEFDIVTVAKFTFGAMENKGLNVFRDSLILASPETATDADYQRITDVVGHEYFHNWSGNRVTVANWFNVSLKEGLTVIREQMFTAFTTSNAVQRINAVKLLRSGQFPLDDGPLAHPVMPQEVGSVENCYTLTTYEKGAEVLRMMKELMGEDKFIEGVKHYFKTNDGHAVTINEFIKSMEHVSGLNLSGQFKLWYTQSGRPRVKAEGRYDAAAKTYTLTLSQNVPPTRDQAVKQPMYIPVRAALVNHNGANMNVDMDGASATDRVLHFTQPKQDFVFRNVTAEPAFHSLLRGFSAPIDMDTGLTEDQLYKQLLTDPDGFNRWDAGQNLALREMKRLYDAYLKTGKMPMLSPRYITALSDIVRDKATDPALAARAVMPPGIREFEATVKPVSPSAVSAVLRHMKESIDKSIHDDFEAAFARTHDGKAYAFDYDSVGRRDMKRLAVDVMLANGGADNLKRAKEIYDRADNMTDRMIAMAALRNHFTPEREAAFDDFYKRFSNDQLTIQKWFSMQALSENDKTIDKIRTIIASKVFSWENPGHAGSLIGGFAGNYQQFHRPDGKGYEFLADCIIKADKINGMTASRLIEPLCNWQKYTPDHKKPMIAQLERIAAAPGLSQHVKDKLFKSLPDLAERQALGLPPKP